MDQTDQAQSGMRLYGPTAERLYINAEERRRFLRAADDAHPLSRSLAQTLTFTGCRLSEALALTGASIQNEARVVTFRTLKRRNQSTFREVPVPTKLLQTWTQVHELNKNELLYRYAGVPVHRTTGYRWIKSIMRSADIAGLQACPKGLRHGFGVHAVLSGVPLNMTQKWMGHASMSTTSIYTNVSGAEEQAVAGLMWKRKNI